MKAAIALALLCATLCLAAEKYTTKYDNIDVEEILNNSRLYKKYFDCLVNKGKCTPDGAELKKLIPDALATSCSKCSERQKAETEHVIKHVIKNKPSDYEVLEKLYDPQGVYRKKYEAEAKKHGVELPAKN